MRICYLLLLSVCCSTAQDCGNDPQTTFQFQARRKIKTKNCAWLDSRRARKRRRFCRKTDLLTGELVSKTCGNECGVDCTPVASTSGPTLAPTHLPTLAPTRSSTTTTAQLATPDPTSGPTSDPTLAPTRSTTTSAQPTRQPTTDQPTTGQTNPSVKSFTFAEDLTVFNNPERGFHGNFDLVGETTISWIPWSIARTYIRLDDYRESDIPQAFLDLIVRGLEAARSSGKKIILRVSYNFPGADYESAQDASKAWIMRHLEQLGPIFKANSDVIMVHQAGFIGAWGEWHASSNGLTTLENRRDILNGLIEAFSDDRMVQIRYPAYLIDEFPVPIQSNEAYDGSSKIARVGFHNDCFLAGELDTGTYWPADQADEFKNYIEAMSQYTMVGGETCAANVDTHRTDCPTALAEMERFHYTYMNRGFYTPAIDRWFAEGCFDTIEKKLGYRYLLKTATVEEASPGSVMTVKLQVANDGWAGLSNPRPWRMVLASAVSDDEIVLGDDELPADVRNVLPGAGEEKEIAFRLKLPQTLSAGDYVLKLDLPDASETLVGRAEYSIRLASESVWEESTGYNIIGQVQVL